MSRKELLFITPVMPSREGRGRNHRAFLWVNKLSEKYDVTVLCTSVYGQYFFEEDEHLSYLGCRVFRWEHSSSIFKKIINLFLLRPLSWNTKGAKCELELKLLNIAPPDIILCFRLQNAQIAFHAKKVWKNSELWLDLDELDSQTKKNISKLAFENGHFREAIKARINAFLFHLWETKMIPLFDKIYTSTKTEMELLRSAHGFHKTEVFRNRLPQSLFNSSSVRMKDTFRFLFVGDCNYYPNADAINMILQEIAPQLKRICVRDFEFVIITGNLSQLQMNKIERIDFIHSYTNVNNLEIVYNQTDVVIVPLRAGGGSSLKFLEALQYSKPLISTVVGARGFDIKHEEQALIGATMPEIVQHCISLIDSPKLARKIAKKGHRWFLENNSYKLISKSKSEQTLTPKIVPHLY